VPFLDVVESMLPWLQIRSIGVACLAIGHLAFVINFLWMLFATGFIRAKQGPTLLESANQEGAA